MHRIDADAHVSNLFSDGDALIGQPGTKVDAAWLNAAQEEIVAVIEDAGIALVKGTNNQLLAAINDAIEARFPSPSWTNLTLGSNWTAGTVAPAYWQDHAGIVHFRGWATSTGITGLLCPVGALPTAARPSVSRKHAVAAVLAGSGAVTQGMWIYADGSIASVTMAVGDVCHLDSITYPAG